MLGSPAMAASHIAAGTTVQLMVINEVTTKTAKVGDRFVVEVETPLSADGVVLIPKGTMGYGEVVTTSRNGIAGRSGKLTTKLLYLELAGVRIALVGTPANAGRGGNAQIAIATLGLTPYGLFAPGNNAKLKAGDVVTAALAADFIPQPHP